MADPMQCVFIGLGSNLGDRRATILAAVEALGQVDGITVERLSHLYETPPMGGPPQQPTYLNGVARLSTSLPPFRLLDVLQRIETRFGRRRAVRWGPRTLDLDILIYGDLVLRDSRLTVPHPRLTERLFVLRPLAEIAPDEMHPVLGVTFRELCERLERKTT